MKLFTALAAATIALTGFAPAPAQAHGCKGLSPEAESKCWDQKFSEAYDTPEAIAKRKRHQSADGCPAGQGMATLKGKPMGCMTPAQYELWNAQMKAAHRANRRPVIMPAPVAVPTVYNQHLQMQNQINHLQGCVQYGYGCGYR